MLLTRNDSRLFFSKWVRVLTVVKIFRISGTYTFSLSLKSFVSTAGSFAKCKKLSSRGEFFAFVTPTGFEPVLTD